MRNRRWLLTAFMVLGVFLSFTLPVAAEVWVDDGYNSSTAGWGEDHFNRIQAGIDAVTAPDAVHVAAGTYYENIVMRSGIQILGAGAGADPAIHSIINGDTDGDGIGNGVVVYAYGVDESAKLDGFTITNGTGKTLSGYVYGGGLFLDHSSPELSNCIIKGNTATSIGQGGGMYATFSSPTLTNCTFSDNFALNGGGMSTYKSSPTLTGCTFDSNLAFWDGVMAGGCGYGGGMINRYSSPTLTNCTFVANTSTVFGAGMENAYSSPVLINCVFEGNVSQLGSGGAMFNCYNDPPDPKTQSPVLINCRISGNRAFQGGGIANWSSSPELTNCIMSKNAATAASSSAGGAMFSKSASSPKLTNCTLWGNSAQLGSALENRYAANPTVTNCIFWGAATNPIRDAYQSSSIVSYSNIQGGYTGTNVINTEPLFVDAAAGDFRLQPGSPCIDTGTAAGAPSYDIVSNPRPVGAGYDMGAYEGVANQPPAANAGENVAISSSEVAVTSIQGIASDEDLDDILKYRWLEGTTVLLAWTSAGINGQCPLDLGTLATSIGAHMLVLEVSDGQVTSSDEMILTIENSAPNAAPTGAGVYEINSEVSLGGNVSDYDGDLLSYEWKEGPDVLFSGSIQAVAEGTPVVLPQRSISNLGLGFHTIVLCVSDGVNAPISSEITVETVDTTVPTIAPVADQTILWPPNHRMVDIVIEANASDNSGLPVALTASVSSNEPIDGLGDGDVSPDWTEPIIDQGRIMLQLRAERSGSGNGREYTIAITATDNAGNSSTADVNIIVPHDKRKK
ncbi:MAG: right-handed parallel beta-helix repeat-containing protein [Pseudomonadota bacterium]